MELENLWEWDRRKLACRIRPETGNPSEDDLRERLAELAGFNLQELLSEMKTDMRKKKKDPKYNVAPDHADDKKFKDVLNRSHVIGASEIALKSLKEHEQTVTKSQKNIHKRFVTAPKSPPKRVLIDIQRERAKPLRLPDQEEGKHATAKLEKKLAKQRAARMAAKDEAAKDEEAQKLANDAQSFGGRNTMNSVLPPYEGDKFGTAGDYMEGMLYLSRMPNINGKIKGTKKLSLTESFARDNDYSNSGTENDRLEKAIGHDFGTAEDTTVSEDVVSADEMSSKLYCAAALCNWSRNPSNAVRLANEGAVRAIMQLAIEKMPRIAMYCAGAFRYMSEHVVLATNMIEEKVLPVISEMIASTNDEFVCGNITICLLNLTRVNGKEGQLVEEGIVIALMNLISQRPELLPACCRGLYNLTCVDSSYNLIDRVIRSLVSLSSTGTASVKHLCAAALCNLADLKQVRLRMVEEGVISVLSVLARGSETRTRRVCAVILQNLTANKSCRVEMVTRNCVQAAYGLSSDQDPIILRCIGLALSRLALEPTNCNRIINDGGIMALCNIAVKYPTIPGISQPAAVAFQLLSSRPTVRTTIVQEGSVAAIASLLRLSTDIYTLQYALLALCNLLSAPENHLPIVQQGLIATMTTLSAQDNEILRDYCALALFNLSCAEDSRKHIVNAGAISSIINLSKHKSVATQRRCAATLCNISSYETGMGRMVSDGIIPALVKLLVSEDIETVRYGCAALCRLCSTVENGRLILESGAVPHVVQGASEGDTVTKQFCGAVLSSLSYYECCRAALCDFGIFQALKSLSSTNDDITKQRCLVAFANLSCDDSVQGLMVEKGVVSIISELANSYQEVNQICCAMAICNLACCPYTRLRVAKEGGMQALMMISMVRSVDMRTKLHCVRAMANLLDDTTVTYLISEGLLGSVANLCKLPDPQVVNLCTKLFNQLTTYPEGRAQFIERPTALSALFALFETDDLSTKIICARSSCNMVISESSRLSAIEHGALIVVEQGTQLPDEGASLHCLHAAYSACFDNQFRLRMAKSLLPVVLCQVAAESTGEKFGICVKILAVLAWYDESRTFLISNDLVGLLIHLVNVNSQAAASELVAQILCYVALGYNDQKDLIDLGMPLCLQKLCKTRNRVMMDTVAAMIRTLSGNDRCIDALATTATIHTLKKITAVCQSETTLYNIAVTLFAFAKYSPESRHRVSVPDTVYLLDKVGTIANCADLVAVTLAFFCTDHKCRSMFANATVAQLSVRIIEFYTGEDAQFNVVSAIYSLSRIPSCREHLMTAQVDRLLLKLSQGESAKVKANCSRALKNLSSDASETIEEGAVAALIAMSLEGKNRSKGGDELELPDLMRLSVKIYGPPACINDPVKTDCWREQSERVKGGAAGRGPSSPDPPIMSMETGGGGGLTLNPMDDMEATVENEGKTKMAFAKMLVPSDFRDSFLFTDSDFNVQDDYTVSDQSSAFGADRGDSSPDIQRSVSSYDNSLGSRQALVPSSRLNGSHEGNGTGATRNRGDDGGDPTSGGASVDTNDRDYDHNNDGGGAFSRSSPEVGHRKSSLKSLNSPERLKNTHISLSEQAVQLKLYA